MFGLICSALSQSEGGVGVGVGGGDLENSAATAATRTGGDSFVKALWKEKASYLPSIDNVTNLLFSGEMSEEEDSSAGNNNGRLLFGAGADEDIDSTNDSIRSTFLGMLMTLIGSWCFAMNYILAETVQVS